MQLALSSNYSMMLAVFRERFHRSSSPGETLEALNSVPATPLQIRKKHAAKNWIRKSPNQPRTTQLPYQVQSQHLIHQIATNSERAIETIEVPTPTTSIEPTLHLDRAQIAPAQNIALDTLERSSNACEESPQETTHVEMIQLSTEHPPSPSADIVAPSLQLTEMPSPIMVQPTIITDSPDSITQTQKLRKLCDGCYISLAMEVDADLRQIYDQKFKPRMYALLKHIPLKPRQVMIECVLACTREGDALHPTIVVFCLNNDQQSTIRKEMARRSLIPPRFLYQVIVQEVSYCHGISDTTGEAAQRYLGTEVFARPAGDGTICGCAAAAMTVDYKTCTLGGLILVDKIMYALTTAHSFLHDADKTHTYVQSPETLGFASFGPVYCLDFTSTFKDVDIELEEEWQEQNSHDWALVSIPLVLYKANYFQTTASGDPLPITGSLSLADLTRGPVIVMSGFSGVRRGYLNGTTSSLILENSFFQVRSISLDEELQAGDSGSWVVRDGKLCGYILARAVGQPWAYMLPIEHVFDAIKCSYPGPDELVVCVALESKEGSVVQRNLPPGEPEGITSASEEPQMSSTNVLLFPREKEETRDIPGTIEKGEQKGDLKLDVQEPFKSTKLPNIFPPPPQSPTRNQPTLASIVPPRPFPQPPRSPVSRAKSSRSTLCTCLHGVFSCVRCVLFVVCFCRVYRA